MAPAQTGRTRVVGLVLPGVAMVSGLGAVLVGIVLLAGGSASGPSQAILGLGTCAFLAIGVLIVQRRPGNAVGPALFILGVYISGYIVADWFIGQPGPPAGAAIFAWLISISDGPGFALVILAILVFPDGRLPSPRWRPVLGVAAVASVLIPAGAGFQPGPLSYYPAIPNPFGVAGYPGIGIASAGYLLVAILAVLAAASLVVRWRGASDQRKAQLKWVAAAAAVLAISQVAITATAGRQTDQAFGRVTMNELAVLLSIVAFSIFPLAVGIAVLRYRLYEIDRIISRTLTYGALTVVLAAAYVAGLLATQAILAPFTSRTGPIPVIASTLVVFVLFQPARRRLKAAMDRRFNRSRYDALRTVEDFATRLRDEVDIDRLSREIATVVEETLAPVQTRIWLRNESRTTEA